MRGASRKRVLIVSIVILIIAGICQSIFYMFQHPFSPQYTITESGDGSLIVDLSSSPLSEIYYTTDGSVPSDDSLLYINPIEIHDRSDDENLIGEKHKNIVKHWVDKEFSTRKVEKGTPLKFACKSKVPFGEGWSEVVTVTLFPGVDTTENYLSIVADEEDLFGPGGIYSTGWQYDEWLAQGEKGDAPALNYMCNLMIPSNVELYRNGKEVLNQKAGIKIQGNSSRTNTLKKFSILASLEFNGKEYFDNKIFGDKSTHSFMVKNSVSDAIISDLFSGRDLTCQESFPLRVYLNGDFMYDTFALERFDEEYFVQHYGISNPIIVKDGKAKSDDDNQYIYDDFMEWVSKTDFSDENNWNDLMKKIDVQSYAEFLVANTYLCNVDMSEDKNYIIWRSKNNYGTGYNDGRWRWCVYDVDFLCRDELKDYYGVSSIAEVNSVSEEYPYTESLFENTLFCACMENPRFHDIMKSTLNEMIETTFSKEHVSEVLSKRGETIAWNDNFFEKRSDYIREYWYQVL